MRANRIRPAGLIASLDGCWLRVGRAVLRRIAEGWALLQALFNEKHQRTRVERLPAKREGVVPRVAVLRHLAEEVHNALDGCLSGSNLHAVKRCRVLLEDSLIVEVCDLSVAPFVDVGARLLNGGEVLPEGSTQRHVTGGMGNGVAHLLQRRGPVSARRGRIGESLYPQKDGFLEQLLNYAKRDSRLGQQAPLQAHFLLRGRRSHRLTRQAD